MNYNDYIFSTVGGQFTLLRQFEAMYKNCVDPHGQSQELRRVDYQLVAAVLHRALVSFKAEQRPVRILDVGCGLGYFTSHIKERFPDADVFGCDISSTAIEKAAARVPQCNFFPLDLKLSTSHSSAYDILIALDVLYYFTEVEIFEVIHNLHRLLENTGFLVVGYHLPDQMKFGRYIRSFDDAKALFEPAGFRFRLTWDVVNNLDENYAGNPVGRHIYFLAQKVQAKQGDRTR